MAIYARLENGTYAEVTGVYKTDGTEVTEIFQGDRLVYSASNEIYGSLPLYYSGRGFELIDYLISGNAVQDGTPSPDAPVDATGSGVRTGNLWDEDYTGISGVLKYVPFFVGEGTFTLSTDTPDYLRNAPLFLLSGNVTSGASTPKNGVYNGVSRTTDSSNGYITIAFRRQSESTDPITHKTMLNLGSTALPYEPYGFKLPLTVNGTEHPIYLGQVETTRRVKKLVLTGEDGTWKKSTAYQGSFYNTLLDTPAYTIPILCSHAVYTQQITPTLYVYGKCTVDGSGDIKNLNLFMGEPSWSVSDFQQYLAAQYAAGTPVTVWYVLATPETGIVNEPLMKIGDYADTVSFAQAGVTIPTVSGANVLDMASPVKPSEMYIKGKGIKSTGYGQLKDVNDVNILDKDGNPIYVHGQ